MRSLWSKASYKYRIGGGHTMHYRSLDSVYKDKIAQAQIKTIQEYCQRPSAIDRRRPKRRGSAQGFSLRARSTLTSLFRPVTRSISVNAKNGIRMKNMITPIEMITVRLPPPRSSRLWATSLP